MTARVELWQEQEPESSIPSQKGWAPEEVSREDWLVPLPWSQDNLSVLNGRRNRIWGPRLLPLT